MSKKTIVLVALGLGAVYLFSRRGRLSGLGALDPAKLDVSTTEDLIGACENLVSLEEHLARSAAMTGDASYLTKLEQVREIRRSAMSKLPIRTHGGEDWCACKHCLASSMRLSEVGNKYLAAGKRDDAKRAFDLAAQMRSHALTGLNGDDGGVCYGG